MGQGEVAGRRRRHQANRLTFRDATRTAEFAKDKTCYGQPATVDTDEVPTHIADRWTIN